MNTDRPDGPLGPDVPVDPDGPDVPLGPVCPVASTISLRQEGHLNPFIWTFLIKHVV